MESTEVQSAIEEASRTIIQGFPIAAGLTSVSNVINQLPPPRAFPLSLFDDTAALQTGPHEPAFDQYSAEIHHFLNPSSDDTPEIINWRRGELERLRNATSDELERFRDQQGSFGQMSFPPPNYPLPINYVPSPSTGELPAHLDAFPYPSTNQIPQASPSNPPPSTAEWPTFFSNFLDENKPKPPPVVPSSRKSIPASSTQTASRSTTNGHPAIADSSPDPLRMGTTTFSTSRPLAPFRQLSHQQQQTPIQSHQEARKRPSTTDLRGSPPASERTPASTPNRLRSSSLSSLEEDGVVGEASMMQNGFEQTPSQKERAQSGTGVESAVKRIKLIGAFGPGVTGSAGGVSTGRGTVKSTAGQDLVETVTDLILDLFHADDAFINDSEAPLKSPGSTSANFFRSTATTTDNLPLLKTNFILKLNKNLLAVQNKKKGEDFLAEMEEGGISRLLKILERNWRGAEDLRFWSAAALVAKAEEGEVAAPGSGQKGKGRAKGKSVSPSKPATKRKSKVDDEYDEEDEEDDEDRYLSAKAGDRRTSTARSSRSRSRSKSPNVGSSKDVEMDELDRGVSDAVWTEENLAEFSSAHRNLSDALLSIRGALILLSLARLPKQLYSADYITSLLSTLRSTLDNFLYPLLECSPHSHLADLAELQSANVTSICASIEATVSLVARLIQHEEMSEDIIISTIYFSLSPFFHEVAVSTGRGRKTETNVVEKSMKAVRMASLSLVRVIFGRHVDQRDSIIEEIMVNLTRAESMKKGKGSVRLRNGASIHTVSALLLHLVQTCPTDLRAKMRAKLAKSDEVDLVEIEMKDGTQGDVAEEADNSPPLAQALKTLVDPALESAMKSARSIVGHLLSKSCKTGKVAATTTESEYRGIFDNFVNDLLSTLRMPEWPASEILLSVCTRSMMTAMADSKTTLEVNAMKGVALDHLGAIGARLRQDSLDDQSTLKTLPEIIETADVAGLDTLMAYERELIEHLSRGERLEGTIEGAAEFTSSILFRDLVQASTICKNRFDALPPSSQTDTQEGRKSTLLLDRFDVHINAFWEPTVEDDVFAPSADDDGSRTQAISQALSRTQPLAGLYAPLLKQILDISKSTTVSFRTKSIRAISLIVAHDPDLFHDTGVKNAIEARMLDSSPAVRDAALELVGKYVVSRPDLAAEYLPKICARTNDTGLGVRRRVVKLLKAIYIVSTDRDAQVEICRRLVWRVQDEDDGIRELAVDVIEELWFSKPKQVGFKEDPQGADLVSKNNLSNLAAVIMTVTGTATGDRPPPVDDLLRQIFAKHVEKGTKPPIRRLQEITECLIDGLVEDKESVRSEIINCIKTVYVLTSTDPSMLSTAKATILLPFLKSATTPEEQQICEYLLKIFRSAVVGLPKTASKFAKDLQQALIPMINKPPPVPATMQEIVACFCAVIRGQTHDFTRLVTIFKACIGRLRAEQMLLKTPVAGKTANLRSLPMLCSLSALLCEHGDFDQIRREFPETKDAINLVTPQSVSDHTYNLLIDLYRLPVGPVVQSTVLTCLGFLFRSFPTLMLRPSSTGIMDEIFTSTNSNAQTQLMKIIHDFLSCQGRSTGVATAAGGKVKVEANAKMEELVGNVDGFADSGVASAVCQRYMEHILAHSLSPTPSLQRIAFDILAIVARSGFGHPLSISPTLVALTSASDPQLAQRAYSMLSLLHQKHASLLATRFVEAVKVCFGYAQATAGEYLLQGHSQDPPVSNFGRWYNLHKEKRVHKLDFLKSLSRTFELEPGRPCTDDDSTLARFIAEGLSTLEFKCQEEPMMIISYLNSSLAVSGLQVLHLLEEGMEGESGLLRESTASPVKQGAAPSDDDPAAPPISLTNQSIICGIALLLRDHLKHLYSITDVKLSKYTLGKKSPLGDRAATRKADAPLALGSDSYARMPYAIYPLNAPFDRIRQRETYIAMIQDDGTIGAVDELAEEDE